MDEHAFPPIGFAVAWLFVTFGGSGGIMTSAGPELPYPCSSQVKTLSESSLWGKLCDGIASLERIRWCNVGIWRNPGRFVRGSFRRVVSP